MTRSGTDLRVDFSVSNNYRQEYIRHPIVELPSDKGVVRRRPCRVLRRRRPLSVGLRTDRKQGGRALQPPCCRIPLPECFEEVAALVPHTEGLAGTLQTHFLNWFQKQLRKCGGLASCGGGERHSAPSVSFDVHSPVTTRLH